MAKTDPQKAERWRQHIDACKISGLTRKAYCKKYRLNIHQMDYWRKRLKRVHATSYPQKQDDFIQVQVKEDNLPDSCIKLRVGQIVIEIPGGFDPQHLKNILRVIGAEC